MTPDTKIGKRFSRIKYRIVTMSSAKVIRVDIECRTHQRGNSLQLELWLMGVPYQ